MKLYTSMLLSTLLYGTEITGLRYLAQLEASQCRFFGSLLCLPRNTPRYLIRLETGIPSVGFHVIKSAIKWWIKILQIPENRYPRLCYDRLIALNTSNVTYNWAHQLRNILRNLGVDEMWEDGRPDPTSIQANLDGILERHTQQKKAEDLERAYYSSFSFVYKIFLGESNSYINGSLAMWKRRLIAQLRLQGR